MSGEPRENEMTQYVRLYPRQTDTDASLFRVEDHASHKFVLRDDLRQEACSRCGKCDEMRALNRGAYNPIRVTVNQDFVGSWEHFPIVSVRVKEFLDSIVGGAIRYFDTASTDHFIALPEHVIIPDTGSSSFRALNKCTACGRYSELLWGSTPFLMTSEATIAVFHLENRMGLMPVWVVSKDVLATLTKLTPKFKGFVVDPLASVVGRSKGSGTIKGVRSL